MSLGPTRYVRMKTFTPAQTGVNAVAINSAVTSTTLACTGYTHLTLHVDYENNAGTAVTISYQTRSRPAGNAADVASSPWCPVQTGATTAGTRTLTDLTDSKTVAADDEFSTSIEVNADEVRFLITATGGNVNDTAQVWATLSCRGA